MKIDINVDTKNMYPEPVRVGYVYAVKGGRGLARGHMMVLMAVTEPVDVHDSPKALMLVIDKEGNPRGVTQYGLHYVEEQQPIAFVDGLEELRLQMRTL